MRIARTRFRNFRNLENALVSWSPGLNVLGGDNGAGKTNVLEALHILTGWGTFGGSPGAAVKWNSEGGASLVAQAEGERSALVEATIASRVALRVDGRPCRWADLRSCVQSLAFLPADMALVEGPPAVRRRFLDVLCALMFPLYAWKLSEYRKIARHRRYLLSRGHSTLVVRQTMASLAAWIWECRQEVTAEIGGRLRDWGGLLPREIGLKLKRGGAGGADDPLEDFYRSCEKLAGRERALGVPLVGPHRDDLELTCGGRRAAEALSRGQRRRSALALVLAASGAVESRYRAAPVLLLDEATSELDAEGKAALLDCLARGGRQAFAATAESALPKFDGALWRVADGKIRRADG